MSLQYALKRGIETVYQVEPSELAVEPLPTPEEPRLLMFYESAEGGAGVLERLAVDQGAMAAVARAALEVCHFDPTTGEDQRRAPHAREDCEAACYDCLRSYSNTRYHEILDRQLVKDVLLQLAGCETSVGAGSRSRAEQFAELRRTVDPGHPPSRSSSTSLRRTGSGRPTRRKNTSPNRPRTRTSTIGTRPPASSSTAGITFTSIERPATLRQTAGSGRRGTK